MHRSVGRFASHRQYPNLISSLPVLTQHFVQAYISGKALIILEDAQKVLQTVYIDDAETLEAVTLDEESGKFAICDKTHVFIYKPEGRGEGLLRVCESFWRGARRS